MSSVNSSVILLIFICLIMMEYYFARVSTNNICSDRIIIEPGIHAMSLEVSVFSSITYAQSILSLVSGVDA
jgi:hypothetical protein